MAVEVARHFNTAIRWTFEMEIDMVAVQRLFEYANLEPEERSNIKAQDTKLGGSIEFRDVCMTYQPHMESAIKNLSFNIKQGKRVAVVGRTGAGKSSLF